MLKPWMHEKEIAAIEKYLGHDQVMLEWGSGGSTVYFAPKVKQLWTIEHNKEWFDKLPDIANLEKLHVAANNLVPITESTHNDYRDYIEITSRIKLKFDVVLIDGRARVACAKYVLRHLHTNSVVFLHDFYKKGRERYREVLNYYDVVEEVKTQPGLVVLKPKANFILPTADLQDEIERAIINKESLSVVRFGDGEYLAAVSPGNSWPACNIPFEKHMGQVPDLETKKEVADNILRACKEANIIALPEYSGRNWAETREYFLECRNEIACYSANYHTQWLQSGYYDELIGKFKKVLLINGHDISKQFARRYPYLKDVAQLIIPKQPKYFKEEKLHFPDEFMKTVMEIDKMDLRETLCLVGGGFIGKPYTIICADRGGIAIDIGSVFDRWAGYITRGKYKGFERKNTQYEL